MNLGNRSLEDGPSVITKVFPCISLLFRAISTSLTCSIEEDVSLLSGDCEDPSKRSRCKGLFTNLEVVYHLIEGWSVYL